MPSPQFVIPENPGTSVEFVGEQTVRPPASIADTVGLLITHDWGPLRAPTKVNNFGEFESIFGNSDTDGRDAVLGAFAGDGRRGGARAGSVIVYRLATGAAAKATHTFQNTAPANALTLTAKYEGTRGNDLSVVIEDDPASPGTRDRVRILLDGVTVERFAYTSTAIDELVARINGNSKYVDAVQVATGTALTPAAGTALTGGADGTPVTGVQYDDGLSALEFQPLSIVGAGNLIDGTIQAAALSWAQTQEQQMRPVELVFGGPAGETLDQAKTRTALVRDPHVVSLGAGTFHDDFLDKNVGTAKLVGRAAGALAGIGEARSLTYLPFVGLTIVDPVEATTDRLREAADAGVTVFRRASVPDADLVVSKGVTTFTSLLDPVRPLQIFGDPRLVRVLDLFLRSIKQRGDAEIIGLPNSEETQAAALDIVRSEINALIDGGLILNTPGNQPFARIEPLDPLQPDAIVAEFGWTFAYTTNYFVGQGRVR